MSQTIAVLDFGSQYTQVIARRIREARVHSVILPYHTPLARLRAEGTVGVILSGGPNSVFAAQAPHPDPEILRSGLPVLGICYGLQLMGHLLGGEVAPSARREYGFGRLEIREPGTLFAGLPASLRIWNSHGDTLTRLPPGFRVLATTENCPFAAVEDPGRRLYGIQFHPEVSHTEHGQSILRNFLFGACGCTGDWTMAGYIDRTLRAIRETVGEERVLLGLSGGVDSSVAAALIQRAIGRQLTCVFVDNGLLRLNEAERVEALFRRNFQMDLRVVAAGPVFLRRLKGVTDPERKRRIIGRAFVEVFEANLRKIGGARFLGQGTLYPDVIESVAIDGNPAALIKSHHNVGGLPKRMKLRLLEPLRELFKDEVRSLGAELGLPREVLWRQPFPGPGLAVRVAGEVTRPRLDLLRAADAILEEEMIRAGLYERLWQGFCVFLPVRTVGVMGDERTYEHVVAIRAVESQDGMTADWARLPHEFLQVVAGRICNEVRGVNRVVYDVTSKPPGTIEWE